MMISDSTTPNTLNTSNACNTSELVDDKMLQTPLAVLYSIIFILGLTGNLVALWVFFFVHSKKNSLQVFLMNLSFADLLLAVCLPFRIQYHLQQDKWELGQTMCKLVGYLFYMNMYVSITLLGLISIDRYLKIYGSAGTRRKMRSPKWSIVVCAVIWVVALALMIPFVLKSNDKCVDTTKCFQYRTIPQKDMLKAHINIFVLVVFWLVFVSLVLSYGKIALKLLRRSQQRPDLPTAPHYSRVARKSFFVLFLFVVCFVPYHVFRGFYIKTQITEETLETRNLADKFNEISLVFSALNSCLDPVMFFLLSASVRKEVRRFMTSVLRTRDVGGTSAANSSTELDSRSDKRQSNALDNVSEKKYVLSSSS
ncbi:putative G-protein coupled receptor 34b [Poecilia reticulata]|uniref:Probable G-protein coupled receptor 34 n=1 Tax=Poecilia reticulata TaxID=8081 RepID=A0A3P9Q9J2_POERE|nr:PREDICTED: probable G-protein coupled receptor 34 [Poecilia reticulata]XP_008435475.1 PREDICTED: probable G-protein coupled receptor 34 [Poecilia reticulata]